ITSIFIHGSMGHLLGNIFALGLFGSILERIHGTKKFLLVFFASGIVSGIASSFFYDAALGASGSIFGVLGMLAALRPKMMVWTYGVPMPMFIAAGFWLVLDIAGAFYPTNIANMAHIAGLAFGIAIGITQRNPQSEEKKPLSEEELDDWEQEYF
ncbi:MAG TPA: rhomboid family intramembrane serine protease, partial [archaeon]|nr:rhomboid family intramembrane serine protease [archaeon]